VKEEMPWFTLNEFERSGWFRKRDLFGEMMTGFAVLRSITSTSTTHMGEYFLFESY